MESVQVKMIMAILHKQNLDPAREVYPLLEREFGHIDYKSKEIAFEDTHYYEDEFGKPLVRRWIGFQNLICPEDLPEIKWKAFELEKSLIQGEKRSYNFDPGYLDPDKIVLASFKRGPFKIYVGDGVWADMLLSYSKGEFHSFKWSFADFSDGRYNKILLVLREKYKSTLRHQNRKTVP